jgi:very-short-patch-repair endonuclease
MSPQNIVIGQKVTEDKKSRARELRHSMTDAEMALWQVIRANHLGGWHFRRQQVIHGFIVDFYCHQAALVIEIDGGVHETQIEEDRGRETILQENDLRILRFTNMQILENLPDVLRTIRCTLNASVEEPIPRPLPETGRGEEQEKSADLSLFPLLSPKRGEKGEEG